MFMHQFELCEWFLGQQWGCCTSAMCLRKLRFSVGSDVVKRYQDLARFGEQAGFENEAGWWSKLVEKLRGDSR